MFSRYALYFVPQKNSLLHSMLTPLLGYDILHGIRVSQRAPQGIDTADWAEWTKVPAHYGVHATLKAPFSLRDTENLIPLRKCVQTLAERFTPLTLSPLALRYVEMEDNGFFALMLLQNTPELTALEKAAVTKPDHLRRPLSETEKSKRTGLCLQQEQYLNVWGYHRIFEFFAFHITLTGKIQDLEKRKTTEKALRKTLAPLLSEELRLDGISLCKQETQNTPFVQYHYYPFSSYPKE